MTAWSLFVTGLIGGFLFPLVWKRLGSLDRAAYEDKFPHRSYYAMYLVVAISAGLGSGAALVVLFSIIDGTFSAKGAFYGLGWMLGMLLALPIVARSPKRS